MCWKIYFAGLLQGFSGPNLAHGPDFAHPWFKRMLGHTKFWFKLANHWIVTKLKTTSVRRLFLSFIQKFQDSYFVIQSMAKLWVWVYSVLLNPGYSKPFFLKCTVLDNHVLPNPEVPQLDKGWKILVSIIKLKVFKM